MSEKTAVEVVLFKLKAGSAVEEFQVEVEKTRVILARFEGYRSRELLYEAGTGQWADIVHWESIAHAYKAAEAFGKVPELAAFGTFLDEQSITMMHFHPVEPFTH